METQAEALRRGSPVARACPAIFAVILVYYVTHVCHCFLALDPQPSAHILGVHHPAQLIYFISIS